MNEYVYLDCTAVAVSMCVWGCLDGVPAVFIQGARIIKRKKYSWIYFCTLKT